MANIYYSVDSYGAEVSLAMLWELTASINRGALTDRLMDVTYKVSEKEFMAYAYSKGQQPDVNNPQSKDSGSLAHMFEWGQGTRPGLPLFHLMKTGVGKSRTVRYGFIASREIVPQPDALKDFYKRDHIFKEKAKMLEKAKGITINPKWAKKMVYYRPNDPAANEEGVVFRKDQSNIFAAGGGRYLNNFRREFLIWWTSDLGGQGNLTLAAEKMSKSIAVQSAIEINAIKRLKVARSTAASTTATPLAVKRAKMLVARIEREMSAGW